MCVVEPGDDQTPTPPGVRVRRRFGRRGECLILIGGLWMLIGFGFVVTPMERFSRPGQGGPLQFMDTPPWPGLLWLAGGLVSLLCGLLRRWRRRDDWGFNGLIAPVSVWTLAYLFSAVSWWSSRGEYGRPTAWLGAVIFLGLGLLILRIADWPDPEDPHLPDRTGRSYGT